MNTQSPLFKTIARLLIAVMWAQPLHSIAANLNVDHQGGGNTHITSANNGVPVVNIATPNGKGLSHNKFTDYNVGQQGLILNNSTDKLTSTQLGGIIFGNSQLGGKAANTILNEVTGGQRSQLKGYTEVAGKQAHVIVANPHGITCDGCGFINTPHATLTTGQPMLEQGQLKGYDVNGGDIEIAGAGLNASNLSRFDLITRSAKINAELHANELNIITGRNQVEADTLKATAKTDTVNDQPLLAIDSSALGGMYAGAIRLVGTEAGVGVKLAGDMAASAGDIRIDANGKLTLARVSAKSDLHINAAQDVELTQQAYAGHDINIAATTLHNQDGLLAGQAITIDAEQVRNTGVIEAGINADGSLNHQGRVRIQSAELTNSGSIVASRELDVKATRQLNNRSGQLISDGHLRLNAGQLDNRQGLMTAAGRTRITAGHIDNRNRGEISSQQQLSVKAGQLDNSDAGRLIGEASVSVQADALDNQSSGVVATAGSLSVTANRLDNRNQGLLKGAQGVSVTANSLDNQSGGLVLSDNQLRLEAQQIKNRAGVIDSRDKLTLVAEQLDNQSGEITGGGDVRIQGVELDNREGGVIASSGDLNVEAGMFNNRHGNLVAGAELVVKGDSLDNTDGHITSQDTIELQHQELDNTRGVVAAGTQLEVTAGHVDNEAGELSAGQLLTLEGHTLQQAQGRILSGGRMSLNLKKLDNSGHGLVSAATGLEVRAGQLDNQQGSVISDDTLTVQAGQLNNRSQGLLASKGVLRIQATGLDQHDRGELISEQALHLELSGGDLDNSRGGLIYAPELYLQGVASLDNSQGGEISTPADLVLSAARLDNSAGLISSGQTLHVRVGTLLRNTLQGLLTAARDLQIEAQAIDNRQQGTLMGRNNVTVQAQTLDNRQQGAVLAGKQLKMTVTDLDNSHEGLINSQQTLHISSARLNNSDGAELSSQRQLVLNTETLDNRQGQLVSDGTLELTQSGPLLDNRGGLIHAVGDLSLNNLQHVNNSQGGEISSQNTLQLTLETLDNTHGGVVISSDRLRVIADSIDNRDQGLLSGYTGLSVLTRYLDNQNLGTLSSRQGVLQVQVGEHLDNSQQGALVSQHALNVQAGSLNNQHGIVSSTDDVTLQLDGQLDSAQGQIAGKNITITATQLDNTAGEISAEQVLTLKGLSQVWNRQGGRMLSGSALLLQADMIDNQASVLASEGWLSLIANQLTNRQHGGIAANQTLDIQAQHIDNHNQSQIYSQQAGVELKTDTFSNHDGLIQARADLNLEIAGHASNQEGRLLSEQGAVTLQATTLDNHAGVLASLLGQLKVVVQGLFGNQSGTVQGRSVVVQAAELANQSGHMAATAGDFALSTATLNNQGGGLYAHQHLALAADMLDNSNHGQIAGQTLDFSLSGSLNNQSGLIEAETLQLHSATLDNRGGRLRALGTAGRSRIVSERGLDNRNGLIEIANQHFTLDAPELSNQAGQIVHAGSGQFDLLSGQARQVGGSVTSRGQVTLSSDTWENSTRFEAGALNLHVGHFTQTSSGQLIASQSLTATGDTWVNHGLIASDGDLSLTLSNGYSGSGQLVSLGDLDLFAPQLTVAAQGLVYGTGHTRIQGQQLTNRGNISPAGSLSIDVQQLTNRGTLGSAGMLDIKASGVVNEEGLIFSGNDMRLRVGQLSNRYADIYSLGNIDLAGVEAGARAQRVDNISASIEALGDFTLRSALIDNRRDVLEVRESGKYSVVISELPCHGPYRLGDCDLGSNGRRNAAWLVTEREKLDVVASSAASRLQAGGNLSVDGENLLNSSSQISSGNNLLLSVGQLTNQGVKPADIETQRIFTSGRKPSYYYYRDLANNFNAKHRPQVQQGSVEHDLSTFISRMEREYLPGRQTIETPLAGEEYSAIIQAAGQVTIDARQNLENSVIRPGYRYIGGGNRVSVQEPGSTHGTDVQIQAQLPPDQQQKQVDPTALPDFSLPSGDNGLFRLSDQRAYDQTVQAQEGALTSGQGASRAEQLAGQAGPRPGQYEPGYPLPGHPLPGADYTASAAEKVLAELQSLQGQNTSHNYLVETNPALTQMRQFLSSDYLLGGLGLSPDSMQKRLGDGLYEQKLMREALVARTGQRFLAGLDSDEAMFRYLMDNAIASKEALNLSVGISLSAEQVAALTHDIVWMEEREVMGEKVLVPVLYMAQAEGRLAPNGALIQGQDLTLISGGDLSNQGTLRATNNLSAQAQTIQNSGLMQAGERLSLLAEDSLYNRQGGILAGRDVDLTARTGDILNERSITRHESALGTSRWETSFADSAARIEAANGLSLNAGRDVLSLGGVLNSGGDMQISAGRDVSLSSVEERHSISRGSHYLDSQTAQLISETVAGGNLDIQAGRDLTAAASRLESGQNMQLTAGNDLTLASAANESHHYSKSKKRTSQRDLIQQRGTEVISGGSFAAVSGNDLTLISSNVTASNEAYLVAGGKVQLLAEQDVDYSFSEKKKKGSFGRKSFKSDERTQVTHVGSSITSGGDLAIISGDEQRYQAAQLSSGADLTLDSGAGIVFEGVKDLEQQSRIRSKNSWVWQSAKGKGHTDETLIQSQLQAQGELAIRAAERIQIDIKEVNQQSISQTIDAMVQADPQLAWLKDMEQRGDVDWRQVKELHDSFSYSSSGLSGPAAMVIAIVVAYFTAGAGAGLVGATTGTATAAASNAVVSAVASNAAISAINNKGNLGATFKDVTSSDALKSYAVSGITAGLTAGVYDNWTGTQTGASNTGAASGNTGILANSGKVAVEGGLSTWGGVGQFAANQALQNVTSATLNKVLGQEGDFGDALTSTLANTFAAAGFNWVGDFSQELKLTEGGLAKIGLHAIMGGLAAEAAGGDFKSGALVAGANEALIDTLASQYDSMTHDQRSGLLTMNSQVLGVLVASMAGGDETDMQTGAWVAGNATNYNRQLHPTERELAQRLAEESEGRYTVEQIEEQLRLSNITGTEINPGTDMLVGSPEGIYDTGGRWIEVGDGQYIQVFSTADINPEITGYIREKTSVYDWEMPKPVGWDKEYMPQFDYNVCLSCAAGFTYQLNPASLRTIEEIDAGQRALTLGMASTLALPIGWYVLPSGAVLTGTALGAGFDAAGQLIGGNEYRPGQTVIAGVTGGLTYPLAGGGLLSSMALGGTYGGANRALNNYIYDESLNVRDSVVIGIAAGGFGYRAAHEATKFSAKYLPARVGSGAIDPNKPILLQNIGLLNPYPAYVGKGIGQITEFIIPLVLDKQEASHD